MRRGWAEVGVVGFDDGSTDTRPPTGGEVETDVGPDEHVGWRSDGLPDDPGEALLSALRAILPRPV
jgi:hypothetical protein